MARAEAGPARDDLIAELDRDLSWLAAQLRMVRDRGEQAAAARLTDAIDVHLDERRRLTADAPAPCP
jgi:hypothetical protein